MEANFIVWLAIGSFFGLVTICISGKQSCFVKFPPDLNFNQTDIVLSENQPQGFGLRCLLIKILFLVLRTGLNFVLTGTFHLECSILELKKVLLLSKWNVWLSLCKNLFPSDGSYFIHSDVPYHFHSFLWRILWKKIVVARKTDFLCSIWNTTFPFTTEAQ